ncbi:MAG: hypothetical protein BRC53_10280 [Cyanobacteria bacterium SW_6_48_11]|nr:MAG: hypothetical protein BRC53_10280 [Cyanobacteria bacterium SW_6_48_11]PSP24321.1 MAG: hypothetical protein BRC55_07605 [Cyanobacteria bacterium SW_8_48_13]
MSVEAEEQTGAEDRKQRTPKLFPLCSWAPGAPLHRIPPHASLAPPHLRAETTAFLKSLETNQC